MTEQVSNTGEIEKVKEREVKEYAKEYILKRHGQFDCDDFKPKSTEVNGVQRIVCDSCSRVLLKWGEVMGEDDD